VCILPEETKGHIKRLELAFESLGEKAKKKMLSRRESTSSAAGSIANVNSRPAMNP
jgi:ferritin-like metal-binding protein YciE